MINNVDISDLLNKGSPMPADQPEQEKIEQDTPNTEVIESVASPIATAQDAPVKVSISEVADKVFSRQSDDDIFGNIEDTPASKKVSISEKYANFKMPTAENVDCEFPTSSITTNKPLDTNTDGIPLPGSRMDQQAAERVEDCFVTTQSSRKATVNYAMTYELGKQINSITGDVLTPAVDREGSHWRQYLQTPMGKLAFMSPRIVEDEKKGKGRNIKALMKVRSIVGRGTLVQIPLWRSGFWITIESPSEAEWIELNRRIGEEKIMLGRMTHGMIFSNHDAFLNGWILDVAEDHLYDTTLANREDLRSKIKNLDIAMIFWGLALSRFPRGFNYSRSLTTPDGIMSHELVTGLINVSKLLWVDNASFTDSQINQMVQRQSGVITDEMVDSYQKSMRLGVGRTVPITKEVSVVIKEPTVLEAIDSTARWVKDLSDTIEETFTKTPPDDEARNKMLNVHARVSQARTYSAYLERVIVEGEDDIVDQEDLEEFLTTISSNEEQTGKFIQAVKDFINDATVAVIAIPEISGQVTVEIPNHPRLIPINVASVFFTLLVQSVNRITSRKLQV